MRPKHLAGIANARLLVGALGERCGWWQTRFTEASAQRPLEILFPRTSLRAALERIAAGKGHAATGPLCLGKPARLEQPGALAEIVRTYDGECGVAFYVALLSAIQERGVQPGTVILGDVSVQGNIKAIPSIAEPLQVALDNGAIRALVPLANKSQVAGLPEEVMEKLDLVFFGDVDRAILRGLG